MVYKFFDKKSSVDGVKNEITQNQLLAEELHKPNIRKFEKRKVYSSFKDNIWSADLADMLLMNKFNEGIWFLLCVIDIFSKYTWAVPLKNKKGVTIVNAFQKILDDSKRKPNKIWVDKGSELYIRSMKSWLEKNNTEIYSTQNEGKSVVAGRFIRTLKNKIYKHMTAVSKNVYIDKLNDIVNEDNNTYHRKIKMKLADVKNNTYVDLGKEVRDKDPKLKIGDHVKISQYKISFTKGYTPNQSAEVFVIKEVKNTILWTYFICDLNGEKTIETFYEKELQKANQE